MIKIGSSHIRSRMGDKIDLMRWGLVCKWFAVWFVKILTHKQQPHNHACDFITMILWGKYTEKRFDTEGNFIEEEVFSAPSFRKIPKELYHTVECEKPCYSINLYLPPLSWDFNFIIRDKVVPYQKLIRKKDYLV